MAHTPVEITRDQTYLVRRAEIETRIDLGQTADQLAEVWARPGLSSEDNAALELWAWAWENTRPHG